MDSQDPVIQKLVALGWNHDSIRAVILFSSRCDPSASCDIFSDYDVELFSDDPEWFASTDEWFLDLGPVLVVYREEPSLRYAGYTRLVLYEDGTKIDFGVTPLEALGVMCSMDTLPGHLDIGYAVLLDKDGVGPSLRPPSHKAFIPLAPTEAEYARAVNEFWWNSTYVSKLLWRDDLMAAQFMLVRSLKHNDLRRMLEWSIEIDRGWAWKPGHYGRGIKKALDPETCRELVETYSGGDVEELWESLFRTIALYRKTAIKVGDRFGYEYLHELDGRVSIYLQTVRNLDRETTDREELARLLKESLAGREG